MSAKNQKLNLDKDTLYQMYIVDKMTTTEIGKVFDCTSKSIRNYLTKYEIPVRPNGEAVKLERSKWSQEKEDERSRNVAKAWASKTPEEMAEINAKRVPKLNSPEAIAKAKETKYLNGTYK